MTLDAEVSFLVPPTDGRFCTSCKSHEVSPFTNKNICNNSTFNPWRINPVDGSRVEVTCDEARRSQFCGKRGFLWAPKEDAKGEASGNDTSSVQSPSGEAQPIAKSS